MKAILLLTLLLGTGPTGPSPVRVTFSPMTKAAYWQAEKGQIITKPHVTFPLKKQRGCISIPTAKGPKLFADVIITEASIKQGHGEEESTNYTYLGYLPDFKCHVVHVSYYETEQWLLLDTSGKQMTLWGEPVCAPDKQHLAAICRGIAYGGGQPNIIQLLGVQKGVLHLAWSREPKTWEPTAIGWLSNNTLLLTKLMDPTGSGTTYSYSKLSIQ